MRKPDYYKTPLRTRQEIMRFIINATNQRSYHQPHPLCFNVKCHHVNLDFNHLLTLWNEYESNPIYTHNEEWLKSATQRRGGPDAALSVWVTQEQEGLPGGRSLSLLLLSPRSQAPGATQRR